ncbi:hypothetical protein B9Z19DRAFT_477295 [Tuber borchii]|uniref:Transmembrane protein n=1 Tax=Tuber borchii TaxID=42251 RepID=A0A2T7A3F7_TUBBO|nr:hypothetical protein B9Z19DRAFT_477295 [Tuber borchii]
MSCVESTVLLRYQEVYFRYDVYDDGELPVCSSIMICGESNREVFLLSFFFLFFSSFLASLSRCLCRCLSTSRFSFSFSFFCFLSFFFPSFFFRSGVVEDGCCGSPVVTGFPLRGVINRVGGTMEVDGRMSGWRKVGAFPFLAASVA